MTPAGEDFSRWLDLDAAVTVCDAGGVVVYMNQRSIDQFASDGGAALIGRNLFDCHGPASSEKIRALIAEDRDNLYFAEKRGKRKLVWQVPWHLSGQDGSRRVGGLVEISFPADAEIPVLKRG